MSPYSHPVTPISDISKYFQKNEDDRSMTFVGKTLEIRIPKRFESLDMLSISDKVTALGVMDLIIDGKYQTGLNLLAQITIEPSDIGKMTYDGVDYVVLHLETGDKFMTSYTVVRDPRVVYVLWVEFITYGNVIYTLSYDGLLSLFEHVREFTGGGIGVARSVYEGIVAHISRDPDDLTVQYRLTDRKKPFKLIALNSVSLAPTSTIARLNGSYLRSEALTSALNFEVDSNRPFEDLLRGIKPWEADTNDAV